MQNKRAFFAVVVKKAFSLLSQDYCLCFFCLAWACFFSLPAIALPALFLVALRFCGATARGFPFAVCFLAPRVMRVAALRVRLFLAAFETTAFLPAGDNCFCRIGLALPCALVCLRSRRAWVWGVRIFLCALLVLFSAWRDFTSPVAEGRVVELLLCSAGGYWLG